MQSKPILCEADVNNVIDAARQQAQRNDWVVTIAVTDDGGHLLGLSRLDGAAPFSASVAAEKARSAALGRKETQVFEDMINAGRHAFLSAPLEGLMTGGIPIKVKGQVIGAVGVSGATPEQDAQAARAGSALFS